MKKLKCMDMFPQTYVWGTFLFMGIVLLRINTQIRKKKKVYCVDFD